MGSYLGQNFLRDKKYVDFIISRIKTAFEKNNFSVIFEIGPGKGALTKHLSEITNDIVLFEKDLTFTEILQNIVSKEKIVFGDVLEQDLNEVVEKFELKLADIAIVGNIPYYITSPIFRKFFVNTSFRYGIFMIQKEVGEKIKIDAEKKSYLRWLVNFDYEVKYIKTVPAKAFSPAPKVDSCLVELKIKNEKPSINFDELIALLDQISMYKRKTLGKIWKMVKDKNKDFSIILPVDLAGKRLEEIGWEDMQRILNK